jgi:hypothetical protein
MTSENAGRRTHFPVNYTIDARTPSTTAEMFRERHYPPEHALSHSDGVFRALDGQKVNRPLRREQFAAQVFQFMRLGCNSTGEPFSPTPSQVNAVLRCLAMASQVIYIPSFLQ